MADLSKLEVGTYTIVYSNGEHRTLRVKEAKGNNTFPPNTKIIGYLYGPNNEKDYMYFGHIKEIEKVISESGVSKKEYELVFWKSWKTQEGIEDNPFMKSPESNEGLVRMNRIRRAVEIIAGDMSGTGKEYAMKSGRCWRCNRKLTVPSSIESGIGPECASKIGL